MDLRGCCTRQHNSDSHLCHYINTQSLLMNLQQSDVGHCFSDIDYFMNYIVDGSKNINDSKNNCTLERILASVFRSCHRPPMRDQDL